MRLDELYQEERGGTFRHDGKIYDLNKLLRLVDKTEIVRLLTHQLEWVLEWDEPDAERIEKADLTTPILVTWWQDNEAERPEKAKLVVLDGLHRLFKARKLGRKTIWGKYVSKDILAQCEKGLVESWEGGNDHPHKIGSDEWFKIFYRYLINVDQAKRMIAAGNIHPKRVNYSIRFIAEKIFKMDPKEFGSKNFKDTGSFSLTGPPVTRSLMKNIPDDKNKEPLLWVMFNAEQAEAIVDKKKYSGGGKEFPTLVDGNHRLIKRFLMGEDAEVECDFIVGEDVLKVCYGLDMKTPLDQYPVR